MPDQSFFQKGQMEIVLSFISEPATLTWEFTRWRSRRALPFAVVNCRARLSSSEITFETVGLGIRFLFKNALLVSFAEAWERLVFLSARGADFIPPCSRLSTNGYAAGATEFSAKRKAKEELIERSLVLSSWRSQTGWTQVFPRGLRVRFFIALLKTWGWDCSFFRIDGEDFLGSALVALGVASSGGFVCDSVFLSISEAESCALKLIQGLVSIVTKVEEENPEPLSVLPDKAEPDDHLHYYLLPEHRRALDWVFASPKQEHAGLLPLNSKTVLVTQLKTQPRVDLIVANPGLPFVALAYEATWPVLSWGKKSLVGGNNWPHPLA